MIQLGVGFEVRDWIGSSSRKIQVGSGPSCFHPLSRSFQVGFGSFKHRRCRSRQREGPICQLRADPEDRRCLRNGQRATPSALDRFAPDGSR